jgi:KipI family sensor histidine kinase inhibitor
VGVEEIVPNLVSVLVRYDPSRVSFAEVQGELRLRLFGLENAGFELDLGRKIAVRFGGEDGPDLKEVAGLLGITADAFIVAHNRADLRVLATGFAPGFVYCGFHSNDLVVPRRAVVRPKVPAGSVLFAAGQTAIAATDIPTGWHVIGRTDFRNFDPMLERPTVLSAGERLTFEVAL